MQDSKSGIAKEAAWLFDHVDEVLGYNIHWLDCDGVRHTLVLVVPALEPT